MVIEDSNMADNGFFPLVIEWQQPENWLLMLKGLRQSETCCQDVYPWQVKSLGISQSKIIEDCSSWERFHGLTANFINASAKEGQVAKGHGVPCKAWQNSHTVA